MFVWSEVCFERMHITIPKFCTIVDHPIEDVRMELQHGTARERQGREGRSSKFSFTKRAFAGCNLFISVLRREVLVRVIGIALELHVETHVNHRGGRLFVS